MSISVLIAKLESADALRHNKLIPATLSTTTCGNMFETVIVVEQVGGVFIVTETCAADYGDFAAPSVCYFPDLNSAEAYVEFRAADMP